MALGSPLAGQNEQKDAEVKDGAPRTSVISICFYIQATLILLSSYIYFTFLELKDLEGIAGNHFWSPGLLGLYFVFVALCIPHVTLGVGGLVVGIKTLMNAPKPGAVILVITSLLFALVPIFRAVFYLEIQIAKLLVSLFAS